MVHKAYRKETSAIRYMINFFFQWFLLSVLFSCLSLTIVEFIYMFQLNRFQLCLYLFSNHVSNVSIFVTYTFPFPILMCCLFKFTKQFHLILVLLIDFIVSCLSYCVTCYVSCGILRLYQSVSIISMKIHNITGCDRNGRVLGNISNSFTKSTTFSLCRFQA